MKLYDAPACPFCARVRIVLAEKGLEYETVEVDLRDRPAWLYELNPSGKVPVLDDGFALPESAVIMEYLEERHPAPPLLPPLSGRAGAGAARRLPLRRAARRRLLRVPPRRAERARRAARRAAGRAQPLLRHRLRAVGDPRPRPLRRWAAAARSSAGSTRSRSGPRSQPSSSWWPAL